MGFEHRNSTSTKVSACKAIKFLTGTSNRLRIERRLANAGSEDVRIWNILLGRCLYVMVIITVWLFGTPIYFWTFPSLIDKKSKYTEIDSEYTIFVRK